VQSHCTTFSHTLHRLQHSTINNKYYFHLLKLILVVSLWTINTTNLIHLIKIVRVTFPKTTLWLTPSQGPIVGIQLCLGILGLKICIIWVHCLCRWLQDKFVPALNWLSTMLRGKGGIAPSFLTSVLDGNEWSA
jgi:hypothetical protein